MNLLASIDLFLQDAAIAERARKAWHQKPTLPNKVIPAMNNETLIAKLLGGESSMYGRLPFDVVVNGVGIEIKTRFPGADDRCNLHRKGAQLKEHAAKQYKAVYTLAVDSSKWGVKPITDDAIKSGQVPLLIKSGIGAFHYSSMHPVSSLDELRKIIRTRQQV